MKIPDSAWRSMEDAPRDGTVIDACARYKNATAGAPAYVAFMKGEWRELGRTLGEPLVCWAWRPRTSWPREDWQDVEYELAAVRSVATITVGDAVPRDDQKGRSNPNLEDPERGGG